MSKFLIAYVTVPRKKEARKIAKLLVEEKLAACVNLIEGMESFYEWKGKLCRDKEVILFIKTKQSLFTAVKEKVESVHSYEVPCVVAFPITDGNEAYLKWLEEQTT